MLPLPATSGNSSNYVHREREANLCQIRVGHFGRHEDAQYFVPLVLAMQRYRRCRFGHFGEATFMVEDPLTEIGNGQIVREKLPASMTRAKRIRSFGARSMSLYLFST